MMLHTIVVSIYLTMNIRNKLYIVCKNRVVVFELNLLRYVSIVSIVKFKYQNIIYICRLD